MATFLYRLGRFAFRRRWTIALGWVMLLVLAVIGAASTNDEPVESFDIPGMESSETMDLLNERFPGMAADGATGRVVFAAPDGETLTDPSHEQVVQSVVREIGQVPGLAHVTDPFQSGAISPSGDVAYAEVTFEASVLNSEEQEALLEVAENGRDAGLTVEIGGAVAAPEMDDGEIGELIGIAIAALVLVITFGSFVAAGLPLLNAVVGVGVTLSLITIATRFFELSGDASVLALMLGLALAIDYSLFIAFRYRHELTADRGLEEAAGRAVGTAGNAVVFAGLTVVIALAGLTVVGIPVLTQMGLAAAMAVAIAVIAALTLLPAMFSFAGRRILGGRIARRRERASNDNGKTVGLSWAQMVTRNPLRVLLVAFLAVGTLAVPAMSTQLGIPDDGTYAEDDTRRQAYDLLADGFGPGVNGPLAVVVDGAGAGPVDATLPHVVEVISELDNVVIAEPTAVDEAGATGVISVVAETGPGAEETKGLVDDIRDVAPQIEAETGAVITVTGPTAVTIDFSQKMSEALTPYLSVVVGLSFVLMILVFRSILVPLKAALGFLVTMGATFGATVAVFQWGWLADVLGVEQTGPIFSLLPVVLIGVVFGLAMDYQVFLVTRMREEHVHGMAATPAVISGFQHSARVVTAAAIIMISVFGAFIFDEGFIKQISFALAFAVFIDAFVVRMTIVPAVLALLGERAWWMPRWLDRLVPNVDVEGEKLRDQLDWTDQPAQPDETAVAR
ncbi:MMPL family transporter [Phytoactinopolyspora sp. XMNu-373]|uniref:MMPL family transporter n=1 Tax=Phytoactinopolyspora mesophila TaxID=2650750 RepID=A0A7K3MC68_9ACTN|nr:MMPL family transporter [Phytoactinopolyspora mesophila]